MSAAALNPLRVFADLWRHRYLLGQLIKRDVLLRYRGAFGMLWIFLSPLILLAMYALVFGAILQTRWPQEDSHLPFWVPLYAGFFIFNIFAETISRAPTSVRAYPNFVKKIVFPVHILPTVAMGAALVHGGFNFLLLIAVLIWAGAAHGEIVLLPLLLLPILLLALGVSWIVAAWGVFIKDMTQVVPLLVQMLLFLSPVLYPVNAVPQLLRPIYRFNPLAVVIDACRATLTGRSIEWSEWGVVLAFGAGVFVLGYAFFQRHREEFADVL
jgi:lipopolysaccharide transport system permease protein